MMKHLLPLLLCCLLLAACAPKESVPTIAPTAPPVTFEPTEAATDMPTEFPTESTVLSSFILYHGDENAEKLLPKEVLVPEISASVVNA